MDDTALQLVYLPYCIHERVALHFDEVVYSLTPGFLGLEVSPRTIFRKGQRAVTLMPELSGTLPPEVVRLAELHILIQIHLLGLCNFLLAYARHTLPPIFCFPTCNIYSLTIISLINISISSV